MRSRLRVLAVAHDAGGTRAVIPVAEELVRRGALVAGCGGGPAVSIWRGECPSIPFTEIPEDVSRADAEKILDTQATDTLFTASGLYNRLEHTFRLAGKRRGLRTVAVLDSWLNYKERFERRTDGEIIRSHPDTVCVIDDLSYQGMLATGFTPAQLVLTGAPNLEASARLCRSVSSEQRAAWRAEYGLATHDLVVTFFSDPFVTGPNGEHFSGPGALIGPEGESLFGYTSIEILRAVLEELEAACRLANRPCKLVVKPHPAEYADALWPLLKDVRTRWVDAVVQHDGSAAQWIVIADVLLGMMTIALLEAALAGKPALSVQIGLLESGAEDPCVGNLLGYTYPIYDRPGLAKAMQRVSEGRFDLLTPSRGRQLPIWGAAERVASVVMGVES